MNNEEIKIQINVDSQAYWKRNRRKEIRERKKDEREKPLLFKRHKV